MSDSLSNRPLDILVVDDEELACQGLRRKLAELAPDARVRWTTSPRDALSQLTDAPPDLLFLDVQMPEISGFDLLAGFPEERRRFAVVFCTAHADHAVAAFANAALDFLVKPVDVERLRRTLGRISPVPPGGAHGWSKAMSAGAWQPLTRLTARTRKGVEIVPVAAIVCLSSEEHRTVAYTETQEFVLEPSLVQMEALLDPEHFVRVHRTHLVNLAFVRAVDRQREMVCLTGGREVPLSRRQRPLLLKRLPGPA